MKKVKVMKIMLEISVLKRIVETLDQYIALDMSRYEGKKVSKRILTYIEKNIKTDYVMFSKGNDNEVFKIHVLDRSVKTPNGVFYSEKNTKGIRCNDNYFGDIFCESASKDDAIAWKKHALKSIKDYEYLLENYDTIMLELEENEERFKETLRKYSYLARAAAKDEYKITIVY